MSFGLGFLSGSAKLQLGIGCWDVQKSLGHGGNRGGQNPDIMEVIAVQLIVVFAAVRKKCVSFSFAEKKCVSFGFLWLIEVLGPWRNWGWSK